MSDGEFSHEANTFSFVPTFYVNDALLSLFYLISAKTDKNYVRPDCKSRG